MLVYAINIVLIFYWWFFYEIINKVRLKNSFNFTNRDPLKKQIGKNVLLFLACIQIYLLLSLKNQSVGTDTISYSTGFDLILDTTWQNIFNFDIHNLVFNFERGFIILSKCISTFTGDFAVYSSIIYILMILPLYRFIKNHSSIPFLSLILFITFGFLNFYFSGMRQAIAISVILLSYDCIVKRKMWRFFVLITIATLIHNSAIFFLPAYFMMNITVTPLIAIYYFVSFIFIYIFRSTILGFVTQYMYSGLGISDTGAYTLLIIVFTAFIIGMFSYKKVVAMNKNNKLIYNLIAIAAVLMIFNTVSNIGLRAANYYYIFMILFIPNIITSFNDRIIRYVSVSVVVVFTLTYYFQIGVNSLGGYPYKFFWQ